MDIRLRTACESDLEFLLDLRRQVLRGYVLQTWGVWDENRQRKYLIESLSPPVIQVIQRDDVDIGMFVVKEQPDGFVLESILLLPDHQNKGIGSRLIKEVQEKAKGRKLPVRLQVLKVNPARRLYERPRFFVVQESETHYIMEYVS